MACRVRETSARAQLAQLHEREDLKQLIHCACTGHTVSTPRVVQCAPQRILTCALGMLTKAPWQEYVGSAVALACAHARIYKRDLHMHMDAVMPLVALFPMLFASAAEHMHIPSAPAAVSL